METYLPIIDQYYSDWLAWALINQINAGILAGTVFLMTAMLYSLRIGFLKRKIRKNDKLHTAKQADLSGQIETVQQELKLTQDQLLVNTEQMQQAQQIAEAETERAKNHEALVNLRNEQVSSLIQSLAVKFDLGERPVPLMGDIKADGLWQQHDRVTNLIATRLQSEQQAKAQLDQAYQVETLQRKELEALRDTLQTTLVTQQDQLSKLEQALEDQKSILKVQKNRAEQALTEALAQSQAELARIPLLEQQLQSTANNQQSTQLLEALADKDRLIAALEKNKAETLVKAVSLAQPTPNVIIPEVNPVSPQVNLAQVEPASLSVLVETKEELPIATKESGLGLSSRFKGLFAKGPEKVVEIKVDIPEIQPVKPEVTPSPLEIIQPEVVVQPIKAEKSLGFGKLKGMFGRGKVETADVVIAPEPATFELKVETTPEPVPVPVQVAPVVIEPVVVDPAPAVVKESGAGFAGKFKGLLGKKAPESLVQETASIEVTATSEIKVEPEVVPATVVEVELDPYVVAPEQNPINFVKDDLAKTKAMISSLFGKKK